MSKDKLKNLIPRDIQGNDKKKIENLVFFVVILIITVVTINIIWNGKSKMKKIYKVMIILNKN